VIEFTARRKEIDRMGKLSGVEIQAQEPLILSFKNVLFSSWSLSQLISNI